MKRRSFVKAVGGAGLGALAGAGLLFARGTRMVALPAEPLEFFTPREWSIFHAVAETVVTPLPGAPSLAEVHAVRNADHHLARLDEDAQRDFRRLLSLFDNALAGLLLCGTVAPFTKLDPDARAGFLRCWERHRIGDLRSGYQALKRLAVASYYGSPKTYAAVGYPGPPEKDAE